jgi:hypothetical protein
MALDTHTTTSLRLAECSVLCCLHPTPPVSRLASGHVDYVVGAVSVLVHRCPESGESGGVVCACLQ